jgi:hypothetical protein|tara:strand:+ start:295 stop:456 length:162 start_codon:yes stop_codon:yes gene_type:complete
VQLHVKVMQEEQQMILKEQLAVVELVQLVRQVVHLILVHQGLVEMVELVLLVL